MRHITIILIGLLSLGILSKNTISAQESRFSINKYIHKKDTLNYRLLYPDVINSKKCPLVIFLHGSGERGNDNVSQLKWGVLNFASDQTMAMHPAFVVAPQCPKNITWANSKKDNLTNNLTLQPDPSKPIELVMLLIDELTKKFPIDTNRIYITGISMGGMGTFDVIERYPHRFAAAVPVCGGGDVSKSDSIAHIPMWIFHGAEDTTVNPQYSLNMVNALTKSGAHPGFTLYPEVGHYAWLAAYTDPLMIEWMFRQHK